MQLLCWQGLRHLCVDLCSHLTGKTVLLYYVLAERAPMGPVFSKVAFEDLFLNYVCEKDQVGCILDAKPFV